VAGRIDRVVDGLDEVIRQIRETIFVLERPALADWACARQSMLLSSQLRSISASHPVSGSRARLTR